MGERTALNFLGRLSGIATLTRRFVDAVAGTGARVIDTRKTTPGWRLLEKAAVRAGGGANHRVGLYDMVLVKDNHIDACGGVVEAARAALEHNDQGLAVEVEVRDMDGAGGGAPPGRGPHPPGQHDARAAPGGPWSVRGRSARSARSWRLRET